MAALLDEDGKGAVAGKSSGYWLGAADFVSTAKLEVKNLGRLGFPRDWPNVYTTNKALKSLIGKKGSCAGKKVGVVAVPLPEESELVSRLELRKLVSFSNAERVQREAGFALVSGWAVFEHLDLAVSEAFVAERYWWNALPDGKWVDFTPRPRDWPELLLAEAAGDASKRQAVLTADEVEIAGLLFKQRFGLTLSAPSAAVASAKPTAAPKAAAVPAVAAGARTPAPSASSGNPALPSNVRELVERIQSGSAEAAAELEEVLKDDEDLCIKVVDDRFVAPLVDMLGKSAARESALKLLLLLTDAGVGQRHVEVAGCVLAGGAVAPLARLIASSAANLQELAAAVLGNLCHESPANQDKVAEFDELFKALVDLLDSTGEVGPAQEAAYAIWNLSVGHEENCAKFVRLGAVPKLTELLRSPSDIAQENAAGALMHVTVAKEAAAIIVSADAIPRLCELLKPTYEPEVSTQAAGALLNLASDSPEYSRMIVTAGAVAPLVGLIKDGIDLAKDYAAGALMNLMRGETAVAAEAAKADAIPALAALLARTTGQAEALGALANLASGSAERQVAIYKAQVTRKSVTLLSHPDLDIRRSAAALIMNLAPQSKIKERIVEADALRPLAAVLKEEDPALQERAAGALANLFNDHSGNVNTGFQKAPDMVESLVAMLNQPSLSEDARRQAAHAVAMLAAEDGPCDAVWRAGAGPPLLGLLKDMVPEAALGIMNLSWRWPDVKQELAKGGSIEHLMKMLRVGDTMAKEYAAGALMNMTAGSAENGEKAVGVVTNLVGLLQCDTVQGAEWSAGALANIVRVSAEHQKTAVDAGAPKALAALLSKATPGGRTLLVLALTSLAEFQVQAVRQALSGTSEKQKLREFLNSGDEELNDYINTLVEKLGAGFSLS